MLATDKMNNATIITTKTISVMMFDLSFFFNTGTIGKLKIIPKNTNNNSSRRLSTKYASRPNEEKLNIFVINAKALDSDVDLNTTQPITTKNIE